MSKTPIHNLLTVKETAEYLRIPSPDCHYLVHRGKIPAIQIGGRWRIKKSALDQEILRQDKQGQPTVLVVDDDLGLQDLFRTCLKQIGFSRVVVGTAKGAIKSLRKQKFDFMVLDLQLPAAPGDQVYKAAKEIDPDQESPRPEEEGILATSPPRLVQGLPYSLSEWQSELSQKDGKLAHDLGVSHRAKGTKLYNAR